jgi:MtN3 and saliva related transmembrane protein
MDLVTAVGIGASVFTATSLIPQLVKLLKERKSNDVSILMLTVLLVGLGLWILYGALRNDVIIVVSNAFAALINVLTFLLTLYFKRRKG